MPDPAGAVFDRSFLPPARCEFVVLSDTHYLLHPELQGGEWESIRQFPVRAERALRMAGALGADFVVHLGDVTHEYPETGEAVRSREGARAQFERFGLQPHVAPGNMDIGDKPDPTSPANWVSSETLAAWDAAFGRSWHSFDAGSIHGVVLNSSIMDGPLPEAQEQHRWLEADLEAHHGRRIFLFMHHPPFFVDPEERSFGMYNSLGEPAREWLLGLVRRHRVEMVFAGHTHFVALNHAGSTRFFVAPSTTTSRAGLPEAFTVLPPDLGRSDLPKLGFYLVRDTTPATAPHDGSGGGAAEGEAAGSGRGPSVHLIRTGYDTPALDANDPRRLVLTLPSCDLPGSRVGVVATHPLGHMTPGPIIWPSVVRQRVRNDWPLMAVIELGARHLRVPESDLLDASERSRLPVLRAEGVAVSVSWLWSPHADVPAAVAAHRDVVDEVEMVHPGGALPDPACLAQITALRDRGLRVALSTAIRATPIPPQYHGRTRIGYRPEELAGLDAWLGEQRCRVDRVVCRLSPADPPWAAMQQIRALLPLHTAGGVDLALDLPDQHEAAHAAAATEAIFAAAALPGARIWLAPLMDLDRSFDTALGLLDRLSNPRAVFTAARTLNTVLFAGADAALSGSTERFEPAGEWMEAGGRVLGLAGGQRRLWLVLPALPGEAESEVTRGAASPAAPALDFGSTGRLTCFHLVEGTSERVPPTVSIAEAIRHARTRTAGRVLFVRVAERESDDEERTR